MLTVVMLSVIMLIVVMPLLCVSLFCNDKCHYVEAIFAVCHYEVSL
jgi:hypothetical protein